jgi:hypothetical protein
MLFSGKANIKTFADMEKLQKHHIGKSKKFKFNHLNHKVLKSKGILENKIVDGNDEFLVLIAGRGNDRLRTGQHVCMQNCDNTSRALLTALGWVNPLVMRMGILIRGLRRLIIKICSCIPMYIRTKLVLVLLPYQRSKVIL